MLLDHFMLLLLLCRGHFARITLVDSGLDLCLGVRVDQGLSLKLNLSLNLLGCSRRLASVHNRLRLNLREGLNLRCVHGNLTVCVGNERRKGTRA